MSELAVTLLRLGYLLLLWVFVLSAIGVLRRDLYGTRILNRRQLRAERRAAGPPAATPAPSPGVARRTNEPTRLVVTEGGLRGTTLPLGPSAILIGRAPSCTLVLDDDYSSSRHARIYPDAASGSWRTWVPPTARSSTGARSMDRCRSRSVLRCASGSP